MADEDAADMSAIQRALAEGGPLIPYDELRKGLQLDTPPTAFEMRLPGYNGSVKVWKHGDCRFIHVAIDDVGQKAELLLEPAEARQLAAGLTALAGDV